MVEDEEGTHGSRVVVARETGEAGVVALGQDGADGFGGARLLADPVVEVGREEAGLVAYVVAVAAVLACGIEDGSEEEVEAFLEEVFAADLLDEAAGVLRDVEGVSPGAGFVEVVRR